MSAVEHFDVDAIEVPDAVSCTFTLNGREWSCRDRDQIDARVVGAIMGNGTLNVLQFFQEVLIEDDVADFATLLASDYPLPLKKTQRLMEFLVEQVLNRPTVRPAPSGRGSRNAKRTSGAVSSSPGTRLERSAS